MTMKTAETLRPAACAAAALLTTLLALPASAEVSLSGRFDQSVVKSSPGIWEVTHGSANRLIFRGQEDLGDGTKAYFYLQHRFLGDTGTPRSGPFWYYSYVGLSSSKLGELQLGHQKSPLDDATGSDYEVWDGDTVASSFSRIAGGQKIWDNGVNYKTPSFGGFRINAGVSAGEGAAKTVRGQGISLLYDVGGLSAAISAQRSPNNVETRGIGGSYKWNALRLFGTWAHSTRVAATKEQTDWQLSAGYMLGLGEARVLYNESELDDGKKPVKTHVVGAGYFYYMSKRTALYTAFSDTKTDGQESVNAYQVGIRHSF